MGQDKHIPAHSQQEDRREGRVEGGGGRKEGGGGREGGEGGGRERAEGNEGRGREWERLGELVSHHINTQSSTLWHTICFKITAIVFKE